MNRRTMLAGSGLGAALVVAGIAPAVAAHPDPVVALFAKWRALEDKIAILDPAHSEMRCSFVALYGEPLLSDAAYDAWHADPRHPAFSQATEDINSLCDQATEMLDAMMDTPTTSLQGIRCKMLAALDVWRFIDGPNVEPQFQDTMTVAVLRDAVRVLGSDGA